jgi:DivIVA domain-containing protein
MTPEDIRSQQFNTRLLHGLSPEEVSAFLEDVAEAFANLQETNRALTTQVEVLEAELQSQLQSRTAPPVPVAEPVADSPARDVVGVASIESLRANMLKEVEALLHNAHTQVSSLQETAAEREAEILRGAETIRARTQAESEKLLEQARAEADALIVAAREQETSIRDDIERLTQSHLQLVDDVRATLDTYHRWLASVDPRGRARSRRESVEGAEASANGVTAGDSRAG